MCVPQLLSKPEDIQQFFAELVTKLELIEKSQWQAANQALSEGASKRHRELAAGVATAVDFVNKLKVLRLRGG
jgi:hypothetical protein